MFLIVIYLLAIVTPLDGFYQPRSHARTGRTHRCQEHFHLTESIITMILRDIWKSQAMSYEDESANNEQKLTSRKIKEIQPRTDPLSGSQY